MPIVFPVVQITYTWSRITLPSCRAATHIT